MIETAEYFGEVARTVKTAGNRYIRNTSFGFPKEKICSLHAPVFQQILNRGGLDCF